MRNTSRFLLSSMRGLFVGRFQPLHLGHVSIIEKALEQVEELVIGIGSAECSYTTKDPFTAGERIEMILRASEELGWKKKIIPIPIRDVNRYSIWVSHVVSLCPDFDIVFSKNDGIGPNAVAWDKKNNPIFEGSGKTLAIATNKALIKIKKKKRTIKSVTCNK